MGLKKEATQLAIDIFNSGAHGKWNKDLSISEELIRFAEYYHTEKCKKLPKETLLQNLERIGKKLSSRCTFTSATQMIQWDNAVITIQKFLK